MVSNIFITLVPLLGAMASAAPSKHQARTDGWSSSEASSPSYDSGSGSSWDSAGWSEPKASYESSGWSEGSSSGSSSGSNQWKDQGSSGWSGSEGKQSWDQGGEKASATTVVHETTLTTSGSWETPKHGSGSMPAGDLQSCLNTCHAQFGGGSLAPPPSTTTAAAAGAGESTAPTKTEGGDAASGAGATHTIVVAPTKGVLRFVPFAIEGKEGDTVEFIWGAGPHTVTMSDGQKVCNKSTTANAFDSGKLNATQTFSTKITSSAPQFHYCTVGTHCTAGMFGIINPPKNDTPPAAAAPPAAAPPAGEAASSSSSAEVPSSTAGQGGGKGGCQSMDCWVNQYAAADQKSNQTVEAVKSACTGTPGSWTWGGAWDMSTLVSGGVTKDSVIENMLYSRLMLAMNPDMMTPGAPVDVTKYNAPPPLNEFVAASGVAATTQSGSESGAPVPASEASLAAEAGASESSSAAGAEASKEAANAGSSTSGAAQTVISSIMLIAAMSVPAILLSI
ncbi:hypothetical protein IAT40_006681 [Kwoniella sp. CBS 6097]